MKRQYIIFALLISLIINVIFIFLNRRNKDVAPLFDPFEINYSVTVDALIASGYERIPEDVPLLGKQIGDTLIYYQWECDNKNFEIVEDHTSLKQTRCKRKKVYWRYCAIYLDAIDTSEIKHLINIYDADIISGFTKNELFGDTIYLSFNFFAKHRYTNQIFSVYIGPSHDGITKYPYEMSIINEFPLNSAEIEKRKRIYE